MKQTFLSLRNNSEKAVGIFMNCGCPELLEIAAYTGYQFVIIDNEHGGWGCEGNTHMVRAAESTGIVPIVRVSDINEAEIKRVLDVGAAGVMIPNIDSAEKARLALRYSKYRPDGERGACPFVRANGYGTGVAAEFYKNSNRDVSVILLVEGKGGMESFDDIIGLEGVECIFFGPCDMAVSLGHPGEESHPEVHDAIRDMIHKARARGIYVGMQGFDGIETRYWLDAGADFGVTIGDLGLFYRVCKQTIEDVRNGRRCNSGPGWRKA